MRVVRRNSLFNLNDFFDVPVLRSNALVTDVIEEDDKYLLEVEVPGFSKDNLEISFDEGYLIINAKKEDSTEDTNLKYVRRERSTENAKRSYYFGEVNYESISASFEDGILKVVIPKKEPTVKTINIE